MVVEGAGGAVGSGAVGGGAVDGGAVGSGAGGGGAVGGGGEAVFAGVGMGLLLGFGGGFGSGVGVVRAGGVTRASPPALSAGRCGGCGGTSTPVASGFGNGGADSTGSPTGTSGTGFTPEGSLVGGGEMSGDVAGALAGTTAAGSTLGPVAARSHNAPPNTTMTAPKLSTAMSPKRLVASMRLAVSGPAGAIPSAGMGRRTGVGVGAGTEAGAGAIAAGAIAAGATVGATAVGNGLAEGCARESATAVGMGPPVVTAGASAFGRRSAGATSSERFASATGVMAFSFAALAPRATSAAHVLGKRTCSSEGGGTPGVPSRGSVGVRRGSSRRAEGSIAPSAKRVLRRVTSKTSGATWILVSVTCGTRARGTSVGGMCSTRSLASASLRKRSLRASNGFSPGFSTD